MTTPTMAVGRPGGMTLGGKGASLKAKLIQILAWAAFVFGGVAASPLLAATFLGGIVDNLLSVFPSWVSPLLLVVLVVGIAIDLIADGVPNRMALYGAMVMCSVARSVDGRLGSNVEKWANEARDAIQGDLRQWLGTSSVIAMAGALAAAGWLVSRRTMKAKAG